MVLAEGAAMTGCAGATRRLRQRGRGLTALALCSALFAPGSAGAQTLTQALAEAYNTNPQLLAQRAVLRATDEQVPQALANWRPTVNFTGQVGGTRSAFIAGSTGRATPPGGLGVYSTFYQNSLNLQLSQPIYRGGRTVAQTRQAINLV